MNDAIMTSLNAMVERTVSPISAARAHKHRMHDELLSHLLATFEEELTRCADAESALAATVQRFGSIDELRRQLQASVPFFEYLLFACLERKETRMSKWLVVFAGIIAIAAITIGVNIVFPRFGSFIVLGSLTVAAGTALASLSQKDSFLSAWLGPRLQGLIGCAGMLFGTAIILPALAHLKQSGVLLPGHMPRDAHVVALIIGCTILLEGMGFIILGIRSRRPQLSQ
jgi:hypothetical protein